MFKLFKKQKRSNDFSEPVYIGENSALGIKVERINFRMFYDSEWKITAKNFSTVIVRYDDETIENLLEKIEKLPSYTEEEIKSLDKRKIIWYD